jgi:hypothetical protein
VEKLEGEAEGRYIFAFSDSDEEAEEKPRKVRRSTGS